MEDKAKCTFLHACYRWISYLCCGRDLVWIVFNSCLFSWRTLISRINALDILIQFSKYTSGHLFILFSMFAVFLNGFLKQQTYIHIKRLSYFINNHPTNIWFFAFSTYDT